jgi:hypothetical protein
MSIEFIKSNYFEIFVCSGLVFASLSRLFSSKLRQIEIHDLEINQIFEYAIIIYELSSVYFIFFTNKYTRNIYYSIYIIVCIIITLFYLYQKSLSNIFSEFIELSIFPNNMKSIWYHLIYVYILIYLIYIKDVNKE